MIKASATKSDYDYKGKDVGKKVAERWLRDVKGFIDTVQELLAAERWVAIERPCAAQIIVTLALQGLATEQG